MCSCLYSFILLYNLYIVTNSDLFHLIKCCKVHSQLMYFHFVLIILNYQYLTVDYQYILPVKLVTLISDIASYFTRSLLIGLADKDYCNRDIAIITMILHWTNKAKHHCSYMCSIRNCAIVLVSKTFLFGDFNSSYIVMLLVQI